MKANPHKHLGPKVEKIVNKGKKNPGELLHGPGKTRSNHNNTGMGGMQKKSGKK